MRCRQRILGRFASAANGQGRCGSSGAHRVSLIESLIDCLQVLRQWAAHIRISDEDVEPERKIVLEVRYSTASQRHQPLAEWQPKREEKQCLDPARSCGGLLVSGLKLQLTLSVVATS